MILYIDSSNLVKRYLEEVDSDVIRQLLRSVEAVNTSILAYVEAHSAFARRRREQLLTDFDYKRAVTALDEHWPSYAERPVTPQVVALGGQFCDRYPLKASDAIHLASAVLLRRQVGVRIAFSSADRQLSRAALNEGLAPRP